MRALERLVVVAAALAAAAGATAATNVGKPPNHPQIPVGGFPTGIALNASTGTIYVGNGTAGTLSVIDGKRCNAGDARGCGQQVTAATAGTDPIGIAVDESTNHVYAANASGTVAVVDGRRCDAATTSGCHVTPATVRVGVNPRGAAARLVFNGTSVTYLYAVSNQGGTADIYLDGALSRARELLPR